ncbi:MAG: hypothetical protein U1F24_16030 [Alphaproteobacteria bacterium]
MNRALRLLTAVPLILLAAAVLFLGLQRPTPAPASPPGAPFDFGEALVQSGRLDEAVAWYGALAARDDPAALRRLAAAADLAGRTAERREALARLVRGKGATFAEHVDAAALLAASGATMEALGVLYNAERRFPAAADERFLSFYAALALDCRRPELALPLARRLAAAASGETARRLERMLSEAAGNPG